MWMCKQFLSRHSRSHLINILGLDLFLVDAPIKFPSGILETQSRSSPTLRFVNSNSRGGVQMPQLHDISHNQYSVFENLEAFCQHMWHLRLLFDYREQSNGHYKIDASQDVLPCHPLSAHDIPCSKLSVGREFEIS